MVLQVIVLNKLMIHHRIVALQSCIFHFVKFVKACSQFGASLAIWDFDKDGKLDIAIGSPSYGSFNLTYVVCSLFTLCIVCFCDNLFVNALQSLLLSCYFSISRAGSSLFLLSLFHDFVI